MSIKDKIKSVFNGVSKVKISAPKKRKNKADSELSAEEVNREEIFPEKRACNKKSGAKTSCKKPANQRTRPTNSDYEMIDPDGNTCDCGKS